MGIITIQAKKIYYFFLAAFFLCVAISSAQCPTVVINAQSFCDLQSPTISSLVATNNGGGVVWYANATGGTPLSGVTGLLDGEDYFADSAAGCGARQIVNVTVYAKPEGQSFQGPCVDNAADATIADLVAIGNNVRWYSVSSGGTPLSPTTQLSDNTIYYASQTNPDTGCETSRLSVFVNVGVVPTPTGPAIQRFCNTGSPTIANLNATGDNNWYPTSTSAVQLPGSMPLVNGQSYFATTVDPPCESQSRLEVVVQLLPPPNAGTNGERGICANQVSTTAPFDLFGLLGGSPQNNGTWTGPIATTNGSLGTLNPSTMTLGGSPYVFSYTVNNGVCAASTSTVTINILPLPSAAISGTATVCAGSSAPVSFTGTPNATVTYTVSGVVGNQTIVLNGLGSATLSGNYTSTTTITLVSVASAGVPSCSQAVTGSVTITVLPLPDAAIASNVTICAGDSATVTFTGTPNATVTYNTGGANQTVVLDGAGNATVTNTYASTTTFNLVSVTSPGSPGCTRNLTGSVTITVVQPPTVAIASSTTICPNGAATVSFTGTPNSTITYTVSGTPGNQTIVLNGSGSASITQNYTATTTYTLVSIATSGIPVCTRPVNGSVTITVLPLPTAAISSNATICPGDSATVTFTGTPNAIVTYNDGNGNQTIVLNASGTATISNTYTATTTFTLVSASSSGTPSCSAPLAGSVTITVLPLPTAAISANATICSGDQATVTFTGTPNATVTYNTGGANQTIVLNASGTATITNTYTNTTTFNLVSVAITGTPSCSRPASGSITITVVPPPTVAISVNNGTVCSGGSATVTFTGTPNASVTYDNGGGNQTIVLNASGTATITTAYTATTTFTLVSVASGTVPSCTQPATGTVTITVVPPPTATMTSNATICMGGSAAITFSGTPNATVTYTVTGTPGNQTIVLDATGTAMITGTYSANTTYTLVSVASSGTPSCLTPLTGTVTITVQPTPTVAISASATICPGESATVTFTGTPNASVTYDNGSGNQVITLNAAGIATITNTYTVSTTFTLISVTSEGTPGCTAQASGSITISVVPPPVVSISADATICPGDSATVTFTGTPNATVTYNSGNGNQTVALNASGTATIIGTYTVTTVFTLVSVATSGIPMCTVPASGSITITVLPPPTAGISSNATVCSGESASVTFTGTPGATVTYTVSGTPGSQTLVLDASGSATLTSVFTTDTTYTLTGVAFTGTPGCSGTATGSATITVLPLPVVSIAGNTTICSSETATVTFTGTPNATVTYNTGGANQTIVLNAAGTASIDDIFTSTTVFTLIEATTNTVPACSQLQTGSITVAVIPLPVVDISATALSVCSGSTATIEFFGTPNATVTYNTGGANQTIVLDSVGSATLLPTVTGTITYTLVAIATGGTPVCSQPAIGSVTVTVVLPPGAGNDVANLSLCLTDGPVDLFPLLGAGADPGGVWSPAMASGSGVFDPMIDSPGTFIYTVSGNSICADDTASVTVSIVPPPNAGNDATINLCTTQPPQDLFALLGASAQPGGTWSPGLLSGTGIFDPEVDPAGIYTYTVSGGSLCGNDAATVHVTITQGSDAGQNGSIAFCSTELPRDLFDSLGGTPMTGGIWTPSLASGTGVFNPQVDSPGIYTYTTFSDACPEDTATVSVVVTMPSNAGNDAVITICSNADPQDLFTALGPAAQTGGVWSPALSSGTGVFDPSVDSAGAYTYTVTGTPACGNDAATVIVAITPGPDAGQDGSLTLCVDTAPQDLFASLGGTPMAGGVWSPALSSGTGFFDPSVDAPGIYTYTFAGNDPCDNDTASVTVTVNPIPDAGSDATAVVCSNSAPSDLFDYLGAAQTGGAWSPALASGTGVFNPLVDSPGVYTYSVGGGFCSIDAASVTVTVIQSPNAGANGATLLIETCITATSVDLFSGLNGSQDIGGIWTDANGVTVGNIFDPSSVGAGTYAFTYTVTGGTSPCISDSATVTVIVSPFADAGFFGTAPSVCPSAGTFDLMTLLTAAQPGGVWTNNTGAVTNPVDVSALAAGIHDFTYTITNGCGSDDETVQITVLASPALTMANIAAIAPICIGDSGIIGLTTMADGNYTLTYDLAGANTMTGQTANIVVAGGVGSITIPSAAIPNAGTTTITFTNIINTVTNCSAALSDVRADLVIRPSSTLAGAVLSPINFCLGADFVLLFAGATTMPDGTYQIAYTIPGANPATANAAVNVTGGAGQITIAASSFATAGNYTITITGITSATGACSNPGENTAANFVVHSAPNAVGATVSVGATCIGFANQVSITGAVNLPDGLYSIAYQLSGANTASTTVQIAFVGGNASFAIPGDELTIGGNTTLTILSLSVSSSPCAGSGTNFNVVTFAVSQLETPELTVSGNEFCLADQPTIADLSGNILGSDPVIWYNAPSGGTVYAPTHLLQDNVTYYASHTAGSGCESGTRLAVTVEMEICDDILIPDGFSPNNDGINDSFDIVNLHELYPNFKLEIYNRYGNILYSGNINTPNWDGKSREGGLKLGGDLPVGVYFFILEFNNGARQPIQGRVYLSR